MGPPTSRVFCASAPGSSQLVGRAAAFTVVVVVLLLLPQAATIRLIAAIRPMTVTRRTFALFMSCLPVGYEQSHSGCSLSFKLKLSSSYAFVLSLLTSWRSTRQRTLTPATGEPCG